MDTSLHLSEIIYLIGYGIFFLTRAYHQHVIGVERTVFRIRSMKEAIALSAITIGLVLPLIALFTPVLTTFDYSPLHLEGLGALFLGASILLLELAHRALGRHWSYTLEVKEGHTRVTHGVYRYMRHPMYVSFGLFGIGQALLLPNFIGGLSFLVALAIFLPLRIPAEEAMLNRHLR